MRAIIGRAGGPEVNGHSAKPSAGGAEIILLPLEERSMAASTSSSRGAIDWADELVLEVYPNPAKGPVYLVLNTPEEGGQYQLRIIGANGGVVHSSSPRMGASVLELNTTGWATGLYVIELASDHMQPARAKLSVQR